MTDDRTKRGHPAIPTPKRKRGRPLAHGEPQKVLGVKLPLSYWEWLATQSTSPGSAIRAMVKAAMAE